MSKRVHNVKGKRVADHNPQYRREARAHRWNVANGTTKTDRLRFRQQAHLDEMR